MSPDPPNLKNEMRPLPNRDLIAYWNWEFILLSKSTFILPNDQLPFLPIYTSGPTVPRDGVLKVLKRYMAHGKNSTFRMEPPMSSSVSILSSLTKWENPKIVTNIII